MNVKPSFRKIGDDTSPLQSSERVEKRYVDIDTMNDALRRSSDETIKAVVEVVDKRRQSESGGGAGETFTGLDPKLERQLEGTVKLFNTLKEFSSNPLQKAIETKVGELAAGVVENAFGRPPPKPKGFLGEIAATFLDTQFGAQLGSSIGQRAPELVESLGKTFGKDKAANMIDGMLGKYGNKQLGLPPGGVGVGGIPGAPSPGQQIGGGPQSGGGGGGVGSGPQSEKELLLSLDPNNPEHVSAYSESQGGISVEVARKMLMIHQDEFIKQMQMKGEDVSKFTKIINRGQSQQSSGQPQPPQPEVIDMPGQSRHEPRQESAQIMQVLQQFSGDMNKALGNTNTIINELYKKIGMLENEVNILKGGKDINKSDGERSDEKREAEREATISDAEIKEIKEDKEDKEIVDDGKVNDVTDKWTDEEAQEAEFRMRS